MHRILTALGDPNDINIWSGTPYFFLKNARERGLLQEGLPLYPEKLRLQRLIWNSMLFLTRGQKGGFQYSRYFLDRIFKDARTALGNADIISLFPLLPPAPWEKGWRVTYYIDATLKQNFQDYGIASHISHNVMGDAIARELQHYYQAQRIVTFSKWAEGSLINDYGIDKTKISVVHAGANIDEDMLKLNKKNQTDLKASPFRLGFIGKDWRRKGLIFLLEVAEKLDKRGVKVEVVVIGPHTAELPDNRFVQSAGFIDKKTDMKLFLQVIRSFHFGCLFSSAETCGISNLECMRLGVPVLTTKVGGIPEYIPESMGHLFEPDTKPCQVADIVEYYYKDYDKYVLLRQKVAESSERFSWKNTVTEFLKIFDAKDNNQ